MYCSLAGDIISVLPSPLPSPLPLIRKACAPCACFLFVANVCFPLLNHAYWAFSCSKRQLLLEFLFFILTFQKKALSLHPQRIQYSRISSLSLESVVVYPTISAQGYTWRPVSLGLSRRRAHLSARKGGPFFFSASILETIWNYLERPLAIWTARRAIGTAAGFWNALRPWTARRAILYCSLAADIICVPLSSGTALGHLERPQGNWNSPPGLWNRAFGSTWNARRLLEQSLWLYLERAWRSGITRIRRLRYRCYRCCRSQSRKARGHQLLPIKSPSHAVECTTILGDEISHLYLFNVAIRIEFSQLR